MKEIFFKGYSIDSDGIVYNEKGDTLKTQINKYGYLNLAICTDGKTKNFLVHRLIAKAFIPNPGNKPMVNHIDGNKLNNKISNLEWVTARENAVHAIEEKLYKNVNILNTNESIEIISLFNNGSFNIEAIVKKYKISYSQLYNLLFDSKTKTHLKGFISFNKKEYNGSPVLFDTITERNKFMIAEYIPGNFGNYEYICKKYNIKKSMLYNIVKNVEKNKSTEILESLSLIPEIDINSICYLALKYKVSSKHIKNIIAAKAKV